MWSHNCPRDSSIEDRSAESFQTTETPFPSLPSYTADLYCRHNKKPRSHQHDRYHGPAYCNRRITLGSRAPAALCLQVGFQISRGKLPVSRGIIDMRARQFLVLNLPRHSTDQRQINLPLEKLTSIPGHSRGPRPSRRPLPQSLGPHLARPPLRLRARLHAPDHRRLANPRSARLHLDPPAAGPPRARRGQARR